MAQLVGVPVLQSSYQRPLRMRPIPRPSPRETLARIVLVPGEPKHVNRIAKNMRAIDAGECGALGRTPKQALRLRSGGQTATLTQ